MWTFYQCPVTSLLVSSKWLLGWYQVIAYLGFPNVDCLSQKKNASTWGVFSSWKLKKRVCILQAKPDVCAPFHVNIAGQWGDFTLSAKYFKNIKNTFTDCSRFKTLCKLLQQLLKQNTLQSKWLSCRFLSNGWFLIWPVSKQSSRCPTANNNWIGRWSHQSPDFYLSQSQTKSRWTSPQTSLAAMTLHQTSWSSPLASRCTMHR